MKKSIRLAALTVSASLLSIAQAQDSGEIPDLSWGFVRVDTAGSHSFGGLTSEFEPADLVAGFTRPPPTRVLPALEDLERAESGALIVTDGNCNGPPGIEPNSAGFWYVQTDDVVLIIGENSAPTEKTAALRRVYMDGRAHPSADAWTPRPAGHSIGWYDNGELVVETVGMTPGNVAAGGYRTPETKLTERFSLSRNGDTLTIHYTWEDPNIYARPHSYSIQLARVADDVEALEGWCDSGDPESSYSVTPPPQD